MFSNHVYLMDNFFINGLTFETLYSTLFLHNLMQQLLHIKQIYLHVLELLLFFSFLSSLEIQYESPFLKINYDTGCTLIELNKK